MSRFHLTIGTVAALGLAAVGLPGTGTADPGAESDRLPNQIYHPREEVGRNAHRGADLVGLTVRSSEGEEIGVVSDLVIDLGDDQLTGVVLAHGGFLDIGDDHLLVPWSEVRLTTLTTSDETAAADPAAEPVLVLTVSRKVLDATEPFVEDAWRDATGDAAALASDLLGHPVTRQDGVEIGELRDVLVSHGSVVYAAMTTDFEAGADEGEVLVPWMRLRVDLALGQIILDPDAALFGRVMELPDPSGT